MEERDLMEGKTPPAAEVELKRTDWRWLLAVSGLLLVVTLVTLQAQSDVATFMSMSATVGRTELAPSSDEAMNLWLMAGHLWKQGAMLLWHVAFIWSGLLPHAKNLSLIAGCLAVALLKRRLPLHWVFRSLSEGGRLSLLGDWLAIIMLSIGRLDQHVHLSFGKADVVIDVVPGTGLGKFILARSLGQVFCFLVTEPLSEGSVASGNDDKRIRLMDKFSPCVRWGIFAVLIIYTTVFVSIPVWPVATVDYRLEVVTIREHLETRTFTIKSFAESMWQYSEGSTMLCVLTLLLYVVAMPVVRIVLALALWTVPLRKIAGKRLYLVITLIDHFGSLDMFFVALGATVWEHEELFAAEVKVAPQVHFPFFLGLVLSITERLLTLWIRDKVSTVFIAGEEI